MSSTARTVLGAILGAALVLGASFTVGAAPADAHGREHRPERCEQRHRGHHGHEHGHKHRRCVPPSIFGPFRCPVSPRPDAPPKATPVDAPVTRAIRGCTA